MTALLWDKIGERVFQTGVDRGVLYPFEGPGVAWNGLTAVTESPNQEIKPFYMDGVKYLECAVPGDFAGELRAFTYPDEFDAVNGIVFDDGFFFHNQPPAHFGLSWRTLLGDDVDGLDRGYKIHIVYNAMVNPSNIVYPTVGEQVAPMEFIWNLSAIPIHIAGHKPTAHITIDSTKIDPGQLVLIENALYGTETTDPTLPPIAEIIAFDDIVIIDNGDGTWTAIGPDYLITMLDSTTFQIDEVDGTYTAPDTYELVVTGT